MKVKKKDQLFALNVTQGEILCEFLVWFIQLLDGAQIYGSIVYPIFINMSYCLVFIQA